MGKKKMNFNFAIEATATPFHIPHRHIQRQETKTRQIPQLENLIDFTYMCNSQF